MQAKIVSSLSSKRICKTCENITITCQAILILHLQEHDDASTLEHSCKLLIENIQEEILTVVIFLHGNMIHTEPKDTNKEEESGKD